MNNLPVHVGIIMDGNSRWASQNSLPKMEGYNKGADAAMQIISCCLSYNIKYLTLYAFSAENWQRDKNYINDLFSLLTSRFDTFAEDLSTKNVAIDFIGDILSLPEEMRVLIEKIKIKSPLEARCIVTIAMSYGSRQEILECVKKIISLGKHINEVDMDCFSCLLYTYKLPDPDLIIRTGGEKRMSNFLLWQSAYSELYFCDTMWPDFSPLHFSEALNDYKSRVRRYGR